MTDDFREQAEAILNRYMNKVGLNISKYSPLFDALTALHQKEVDKSNLDLLKLLEEQVIGKAVGVPCVPIDAITRKRERINESLNRSHVGEDI